MTNPAGHCRTEPVHESVVMPKIVPQDKTPQRTHGDDKGNAMNDENYCGDDYSEVIETVTVGASTPLTRTASSRSVVPLLATRASILSVSC